ncbi:MAG: chitobiase/beta-hexosaminidase C-terminal domain-containing protein [Bacteroidales bacterium]|nr:chitobiase/beta-hexosaminidase C-terminal domain-containing protein [Bacteroidales bacterium]
MIDGYLYKEVAEAPTPLMPEKVYMVSYSDQKRVELTQTTSGVYTASEVIMSLMSQGNANYGFYFSVASDGTTEDIYRPENNVDVECGTNYDVAVYQGEGTACWNIAAGVYDITFDLNEKQMSLTATKWTLVKDLGEFGNLIGGTKAYVENTAVAVAQQGKNLWIKDNSGWMLVFGDLGGVTYNNGDVIPALYGGCRSANYGLPELADPIRGFVAATETVDAVQPQKIAANALASTPLNSYVELRGKVTLDEGKTRNYTLTDDTGTAAIYTSSKDITVTTGEKVVVRGFVSIYMKDSKKTYQITPVESKVAPAAPTFSVAAGIVAKGTKVTLTGPDGATVKYQINGESEAYTEYTEPIVINKNTTLRAITELDGILSDAVAMKYQVRVSSAPVITPASGEIAAGTSLFVNLPEDAPEGAAVFVKRIDDEGFWQYINTQPITIDAATTVTAVVAMPSVTSAGMDETDFIRSEEATATYTIATEPEPEDKLYMLGDIPGINWDPSSDKAPLVKNTEGKYVIDEVTISDSYQGYGWFCFVAQLGANSDDWGTVNANRYGPKVADTEVTVGETTAMTKSGNSWKIKAGTYKMVVDIDAMTFVATAVTPTVVYPEKMYIFSNVSTNGGFKGGTGIEMTKVEDGIFRIDHVKVDEAGLILFSSDNTADWSEYAYGAINENDINITTFPATKTLVKQNPLNPNAFWTQMGKYNIEVNLIDNTMYIEQMTWPENVYVIGNISRHHWKPDYTGAKMIMENDGKYHIYGVKFETQGGNEVAYFTLSTMPSTEWKEVNANQYGAVAVNTAIENEVETQVMKGINNWTAAPGTYDITFDFENMKITVKANSETNTIYYKPAEGETMVYMYAYKTSTPYTRAATGPVNAIWPGEPISVEESIDNTGYIRCEVSNTFDKIEFNDGTSRGVAIDNVPNRNYSRAVYLIGDATGTGWTPDACIEMKEQKGFLSSPVYVIDKLTIEEKADGKKNYFYLTATQGETADDWDNVNAGAFGAPEADTQAVVDGTTENRVLIGSNYGWEIPAGEFEVKFKPAENVLILKDLDPAGINNVDADAAGAEYYNIQGIRMNKSQKGLNIIRRNGKTYKTAIR